jgi:O-antigen chain-terminating methyltransferase
LPSDRDLPGLEALRLRLEEERKAYAEVLAAVDRLARFELPQEALPELPARLGRLNVVWESLPRPEGGGLGGAFRQRTWDALAPALARQAEFNGLVVQVLNGYLAQAAELHEHLRTLASALVRYVQRVEPMVDARDRMATALATTRAELILEAFDRRLESLGRRFEGLLALRDRLESVSEEVRAVRGTLAAAAPPPAVAAAATRAAVDSSYTAFENRYRGSREEIRERLASYVPWFRDLAPVADLGCGRGEFLLLLKEAGIAARGVDGNANVVQECRDKGLDVVVGDLVAFLQETPAAALGGVFAAQVAEHLPPPVLMALLAEAHRVLRPGGLLVLETVNPRSVVGLLEVFNRDLTHERPLHPDTLRFLAASQGFSDVRVELRSPVEASSRLAPIPADGLPERAAVALNENVERLNGLLYGPLEYALVARR